MFFNFEIKESIKKKKEKKIFVIMFLIRINFFGIFIDFFNFWDARKSQVSPNDSER